MYNNRKILLPKSSFALANDEDVFISIELSRTSKDIKNERINNIFNITEQYNKERQDSLKFCIFGLVESKFVNTENVIFDIKESEGLTLNLPKISHDNVTGKTFAVKTFEMTQKSNGMSRNLYGKNKSAYSFMFEVNKSELEQSDSLIRQNNGVPKTRYIDFSTIDTERNILFVQRVPYLFYDLDGNIVKFGSQTADVDDDGNVIEIDNDFPFLYDRHWIKKYFDLKAPLSVSFPQTTLNLQETDGNVKIDVTLDEPSAYGLEEVSVVLDVDNTIRNPNSDFSYAAQNIKWNIGEQVKTVNLNIFDDKFVESAETLSFKLTDLKFCAPKSDSDSKLTVNIFDNDVPSKIQFTSDAVILKSNQSGVLISYFFDKAIEVPGQSIVLYATSNSTAVVGTDYILNKTTTTSSEITLTFKEGDISGSTFVTILDNDVYDLEKVVELAFKSPTQNIALSNVGAVPNLGPVSRINIQDSLITKFSSFILMNNQNKKIGAVKANKSPKSVQTTQGYGNVYKWNLDATEGFSPNVGMYHLTIVNKGDTVVYNNKLILKNNPLTAITISAQPLSDIVIELPSNKNFSKPNKSYSKARYSFFFSTKETFSLQPAQTVGFSVSTQYTYSNVIFESEKDSGPSGSKKYYLTTKLKNFYLNYDKFNSACTLNTLGQNNAFFDKVTEAFTNNLIFMGYNPFNNSLSSNVIPAPNTKDSLIETTFEDSIVSVACSQFLSFGFGRLPGPPYKFNYIKVNLRDIYPQSNVKLSNSYNNFKLDSTNNKSNIGFFKWNQTSQNTRQTMMLSVLNNGEIPVTISGTTVNPGEKYFIRGLNQDLNKSSIVLPTNESYKKSNSSFTISNYILSLENISYFSPNGMLSGAPMTMTFEATNNLGSGALSGIPEYYAVTEYNQMYVPRVLSNVASTGATVDCSSVDFSYNGHIQLTDVSIKGILLPNSKSSFRRGYFTPLSGDIIYTCTNSNSVRIPFKQL